jgi:hypothetical protein
MMIEEILCLEVSASRIELAVRTLIRTKTLLPSIAEALAAVRATHVATWNEGAFEIDEGEPLVIWARRALEKAVAAAKGQPPRLLPP